MEPSSGSNVIPRRVRPGLAGLRPHSESGADSPLQDRDKARLEASKVNAGARLTTQVVRGIEKLIFSKCVPGIVLETLKRCSGVDACGDRGGLCEDRVLDGPASWRKGSKNELYMSSSHVHGRVAHCHPRTCTAVWR